MSDKVWVSDFYLTPVLMAYYKPFGDPKPHVAKRARRRGEDCAVPTIKAIDKKPGKLGLVAIVSGPEVVVSADMVSALRGLNLGEGGFVEARMVAQDEVTPLPLQYSFWDYRVIKDSFVVTQSTGMKQANYGNNNPDEDKFSRNGALKTGQIALSSAALEGADIWQEQIIFGLVFFSDRAKRTICDLGLGGAFDFVECRLV